MQIIITGGGGFLGQNRPGPLTAARPPPFTELLLVDIQQPQPPPDPRVRCLRADLTEPGVAESSSASGPPWSTTQLPSSAATRSRTSGSGLEGQPGHHLALPCWRRAAMPGPASAWVFTSSLAVMVARCRSW